MFASKTLATIALLALLPLGACATEAAGGYAGAAAQGYHAEAVYPAPPLTARAAALDGQDGLLSSPPNSARPGECYAKVVVPGQPVGAPPAQPRAVWMQTPPGPGQVSPTWCLYYLPGPPRPVVMTPERFGWIRVICDKDATAEKIRHVQRRLHEWGDYQGAYDGHFDGATARGVARFQDQHHIDHGGYLSVRTMEALDEAPPSPYRAAHPNPYSQVLAAGPLVYSPPLQQQSPLTPQTAPAPPQMVYQPPQVIVERVVQPIYVQQPQIYTQGPAYGYPQSGCGQQACMAPAAPCGACGSQGGSGWGGAYGPQGTPPYRALLTWPGKSVY